jgi:diaminopimelate decarboxylase
MRDAPIGETPAYVYDLAEVRRAHAKLSAALPDPARLYYSLKANPHPAVVAALAELGCAAEVCSPGELAIACGAGVPADRILYTGPGKRDSDVAGALRAGVAWFSADSPSGLDQLARVARENGTVARCLLRVNDHDPVPGQGLAMTGVASQFGADADWVLAEPELFGSRPGARLAGFHLYMGSNITSEEALVRQFETALAAAARLRPALGTEPLMVNLGGGFGAPFARSGGLPDFPGLAGRLSALLDDTFPGWRAGRPVIAFESGRYLTSTCGTLFTCVLDTKRSHGRPVIVLESGINHLGGNSGLRRLPPVLPELRSARPAGTLAGAIVTGPLCTPLDTWANGAEVPDLRPGDLVAVPNVGAYGLSASLVAFLGHPLPREIVVDGPVTVDVSRVRLVRETAAHLEEPWMANSSAC